MKAKCNKDLFMLNGERCFTKGKTYPVLYLTDEKITMLDDQRAQHSVWFLSDGWAKHFTVITEMNTNKIL